MSNIGLGEILLIGILLLVVVGPERLPGILRQAGRYYGMLRRTAMDFQQAFMQEADDVTRSRRSGAGPWSGPPVAPPPSSDGVGNRVQGATSEETPPPGPETSPDGAPSPTQEAGPGPEGRA